jgi:hypothetical protein
MRPTRGKLALGIEGLVPASVEGVCPAVALVTGGE